MEEAVKDLSRLARNDVDTSDQEKEIVALHAAVIEERDEARKLAVRLGKAMNAGIPCFCGDCEKKPQCFKEVHAAYAALKAAKYEPEEPEGGSHAK